MSERELPVLPGEVGASVHFLGGSSTSPVTITRRSATEFEVRYDDDPTYLAKLEQDGANSFFLTPAPGVPAVGGGWDEWKFFYEHF